MTDIQERIAWTHSALWDYGYATFTFYGNVHHLWAGNGETLEIVQRPIPWKKQDSG